MLYVFTQDLIIQAYDRLTRNLTLREWRRYLGEDEPYRKTCPNLPYSNDYEETQLPNNNLSSLPTWLTGKINNLISMQP